MMTPDELCALSEQLLSGTRTRAQVAEAARQRLPHDYLGVGGLQDPKTQIELMLLDADLDSIADPGVFWYRDTDFDEAVAELQAHPLSRDIGEGWVQVRPCPEDEKRFSWQGHVGPVPERSWLTDRGVHIHRHHSDPGLGERAHLRGPDGQQVVLLWHVHPTTQALADMEIMGTGPAYTTIPLVLGLIQAELEGLHFYGFDCTLKRELDFAKMQMSPYETWRLDDNDNEFRMGRFTTKAAADRLALHYERKGHKQTYWSQT